MYVSLILCIFSMIETISIILFVNIATLLYRTYVPEKINSSNNHSKSYFYCRFFDIHSSNIRS